MMHHLPFVISIVAALLWVAGFWAFGKRLGLPSPLKFQQHSGALRRLSLKQYACLYGALGWGIAMFVASFVKDYLQASCHPTSWVPLAGSWLKQSSGWPEAASSVG
jgi:hypothetical protein